MSQNTSPNARMNQIIVLMNNAISRKISEEKKFYTTQTTTLSNRFKSNDLIQKLIETHHSSGDLSKLFNSVNKPLYMFHRFG